MSKTKKEITVFIALIILVVVLGLLTKAPNYKLGSTYESIRGLHIQFEDGVSESEVKVILEKYNRSVYKLDYNIDNGAYTYYINVDKENIKNIRNELKKYESWIDPVFPDFKKGNYYIIPITKQAINDKNFLTILEKNNLQVKKFVWCNFSFGNDPKNWVSEGNAIGVKRKLEENEKIFNVEFEYMGNLG